MATPEVCPVCASDKIDRLTTQAPLLLSQTPPRLIGYRCANGHVFYVPQAAVPGADITATHDTPEQWLAAIEKASSAGKSE